MLLKIAETATVEVLIAEQLQTLPGFMLDGLKLYCGLDQDDTVGSSPWLWSSSDIFRFDTNTMKLVVVAMGIPEVLPEPETRTAFCVVGSTNPGRTFTFGRLVAIRC